MTVQQYARGVLGFSASVFIAQKYLPDGMLLNGSPCRSIDLLSKGDLLEFFLPEESSDYPALEKELLVLWESEDYLVIGKEAGMPVHPSPGHDRDSVLNAAAFHYREHGESCSFRPLYRLDKDTSGILPAGKNRLAVSGAQIEKRYYAVCEGILSGNGTIDLPITLAPGSKIQRRAGEGERAVTHWEALESYDGHTFLRLCLETGRTHQIRVHLSHIGHPLAGDDLYGGSREKLSRQALHCGFLRLCCPALSVNRSFTLEMSSDIRKAFPWLPAISQKEEKEEIRCPLV